MPVIVVVTFDNGDVQEFKEIKEGSIKIEDGLLKMKDYYGFDRKVHVVNMTHVRSYEIKSW